jgi:O-antigen ligase
MLKSTKVQAYMTWLLFALLVALMPSFYLHYRLNGFIVMLVIAIGIIQFIMKPAKIKDFAIIGLMPVLFLTLIFGQLHTENIQTGWTLIERSLSVLLLPFALFGTRAFAVKQQNWLMTIFTISALLASLYCLVFQTALAFELGSVFTTEKSTHFTFNIFMHHRLSAPLGLHAVYFSAYIAMVNIYLFNQLFKLKIGNGRLLLSIIQILFFSVMIFLLKSAIISFAFSAAIILITIMQLKTVRHKYGKLGLISLIFVTVIFAFFGVQTKIELVNFNYDMTDKHMGMLAIRLSIWENAMQVIQSNWLFGVGTGDADEALMNQYLLSKFEIGSANDYNCHNMYLQYWLGNGVLAVGLFITYLGLLFKKAIQHKNMVFIGFLIVFILFSFTESTMRVQKGMVFFMVFSSLFYWSPTIWSHHSKTAA